ncbi:PDZ domain-containing protein, partial [Calditrichota bacterium]
MTELSRKIKHIFLVDVILFVICFFGIYHVSEKAGLESSSHVSFTEKEDNVFVLETIDPDFKEQLFSGDIVTSIEGYPVSSKEDIEFICDVFAVGDVVTVTLLRNNDSIEQRIKLPQYYTWFYILVQIIVGSVFFLLGVFVIYKRPNLLVANVWHWSSIAAAIIIMCTWGRFTISPTGSGHLIRIVFSMAYAFVPPLFLQLSFVFPKNKFTNLNKLIYPLYGFSILLAIWMIISFLFATIQISMDWFHHFMFAFDFNRLYFAFVILFGMGNIIHSYIKATEESERRKIRWVLLGLAIGPPAFVILWQIPQLLAYDSFIPEDVIVLFMLIVPITFSISIVKYNIFDIDLIVRRSTVYFIVVSLLITIYAIIVGLTVLLIGSFTIETSLIASVVAAILIPVFFEPLRLFVQRGIDRKFFHVRYNYRLAQLSFTNELNDCVSINSIADLVVEKLDNLLKPECIGLYLIAHNKHKWQLYAGKNCESIREKTLKELNNIDEKVNSKIYSTQNY